MTYLKRPFILIAVCIFTVLTVAAFLPEKVNLILMLVMLAAGVAALFIKNKKLFIAALAAFSMCSAFASYCFAEFLDAPVKNLPEDHYVCRFYIKSGYRSSEKTKYIARITEICDIEGKRIDIRPFDVNLYCYNGETKELSVKYQALLKLQNIHEQKNLMNLSGKGNRVFKNAFIKRNISQCQSRINFIYDFRVRIEKIISENYSYDVKGLICGILLGDKSGINDKIISDFRRSGISHVLATSGMHVGFLMSITGLILSVITKNRKIRALVTLIAAGLFSALAGFTPSVVRSVFMCAVVLLSSAFYYKSDGYNSLGISCSALLLINPYLAYNVSFLLSASAVIGVITASKIIDKRQKNKGSAKEIIISSLIISLMTMLTTMPIVLLFFGGMSFISPISNLLCIPIVFIIFVLGNLSVLFLPIPGLSKIIIYITKGVSEIMLGIIDRLANLPFSYNMVSYSFVFITLIFAIVALAIAFILRKDKPRKFTVVLCTVAVLLSGVTGHALAGGKNFVTVSFLDVGQGDCSVISSEKAVVMVDCGGEKENIAVKNYFRQNIISRIDYLVLTHSHKDHVSGADDLINNYSVRNIIIPEDTKGFENIISLAANRGVKVIRAVSDCVFELDGMKFTVFTKQSGFASSDENDASIVVKLEYKDFEALFTGDLTNRGEQVMLENYDKKALDIDLLKAGHHGSKTSSSDEFLKVVTPALTVISVAENNRYSLPAEETLARIENSQSDILRTDINSTVSVISDGKTAEVKYIRAG